MQLPYTGQRPEQVTIRLPYRQYITLPVLLCAKTLKRISELISNLFPTDASVTMSIEFNRVLLFQLSEWNASGINAFGIFKRIYNIYSCCRQYG
jgi:hypothetical protein